MQKIHIVICTDTKYVMPCGIMFYSLCKNNSENEIVFHAIIDDSVTEANKESLSSIAKKFNKQIIFYNLDGHLFDNFPNLGNGMYISKATYYRLYLTEILPDSLDKVLYLDCDMIIRKNLLELWNTNIDNVGVAASMDGMDGLITLFNRLDYPRSKGYFNAGVLLVNLNYWRKHNIHQKCLDYIKNHYDRIVSHDQDVLNVVLQDAKKNVSITYNFGESFLYKPENMQFDYSTHKDEIKAVIHDPVIVHYTVSKPWKVGCLNPFRTLYFKYRDMSEWKGVPLETQPFIRRVIKSILLKLKVIKRPSINPFREINFELY